MCVCVLHPSFISLSGPTQVFQASRVTYFFMQEDIFWVPLLFKGQFKTSFLLILGLKLKFDGEGYHVSKGSSQVQCVLVCLSMWGPVWASDLKAYFECMFELQCMERCYPVSQTIQTTDR